MSSLCQERWKRAAVLSPAVTPCLSPRSEKTDRALSRANTVACCSYLASQETAFDGAAWRWGGPLPATATAPASPAWLSTVLPGGQALGLMLGPKPGLSALEHGVQASFSCSTLTYWNGCLGWSFLRTLSSAISIKTWPSAMGSCTLWSPTTQLQIWPLHNLTGCLGQVTKSL